MPECGHRSPLDAISDRSTVLAEIRPLLSDLRCALDEQRPMVDFDFRASSGARLDDFAVNCRLLRPRWMTSSVPGESLWCLC